jgi:hypothetical protein
VIADGAGRTGMFFDRPEAECIAATVRAFIAAGDVFDPRACHAQALRFSAPLFARQLTALVNDEMASLRYGMDSARARTPLQLVSAE